MVDNTTLNSTSGGDTIRDIDRSQNPLPSPFKTQVVALDVGGQVGPENLVTAATPMPVSDINTCVNNVLLLQTLLLQQSQPANGFIPLEIPAFLIGV